MQRLAHWTGVICCIACGGRVAVDASPTAHGGFAGVYGDQAGARSSAPTAGAAGTAHGGSSFAGSMSSIGGSAALGAAGTSPTNGGHSSGGDANGGDSGQAEACTFELSSSCFDCKLSQCGAELESLNDRFCAPSLQCTTQYCFFHDDCSCPIGDSCLHCPPKVALCECVDSCSLPGDSHGCRSKWQRVLSCLATHCPACVADNGGH